MVTDFGWFMQESSELECLVRLLQLSQKALSILDSKEYYEDKLVSNFQQHEQFLNVVS